MRRLFISALAILLVACAGTPELPPSSSLSQVDFLGDINTGAAVKLLHWGDDKFYMAHEGGSVEVLDSSGVRLALLSASSNKGERLLKKPEAVTTHGDTIYVVDSATDHVVMYSADGRFKGTFGGHGGEELSNPQGIAVHEGIVYVADTGNSRIQLFGINGVFLTVLDINDNEANKAAAKKSKIPYELDEPVDVELDTLGRIYVLDADDALVKVYDQDGHYINHLPTSGEPVALSVSAAGIYVANLASYTINRYDYSFRLDSTFGSKGKERAQFMSLTGMASNGGQKVFVGDARAGSVRIFSTERTAPLKQWQRRATRTSVEWLGDTTASVGKFAWNDDQLFAIAPRKRAILRIEDGAVAEELKFKGIHPAAIATARDGSMLVIDSNKRRVVKFSRAGRPVTSFGSSGSGAGKFDEPVDIAIASSGLIFVADTDSEWVQVFNREGIFLNVIRNTSDPEVMLDEPVAIALDPQDNLYVLDSGHKTIFTFNSRGEPRGRFPMRQDSDAPGYISNPIDLMVTHNELLLLERDRVNVYTRTGEFLYSWGSEGRGIGQFSRPTAISARDSFSFAIADNGRLQHFSMLHKPKSLRSLAAKGGMHAVSLQWSPVALPYLDHYQVYRSTSQNGHYESVATVKSANYRDTGLDADRDYYYRVSAVSNRGYESTLETAVSAATTKYIPHVVEGLQATPFIWQVRLSWKPLDESYSSSYRIYKKSGNNFSMIGETPEPEFTVGSLEPESDHTFYVSAISSDGIESEKVAATATTLVATTTPLAIEILEMQDVFSNTYKVYETGGIGRIMLTNNTGDTMQQVKLGFTVKNFMDFPSTTEIEQLAPGESIEVPLKAVFNNNILDVTEDTPVQTELTASYFENAVEKSFSKSHPINVYEKHRLIWDDPQRFASFITPKDPLLLNYVRSVATQFKETRIKAQWAAAIFNSLGVMGITYIQDPTNPYQITSGKTDFVDYVQYPRETLERKSGDCDDLVALYAASLESLGVETRVVEVPGHMLMMFNTGIDADPDGYTMDDMYVIHEGRLWIPVETTVVGSSFLKAWELGSETYYKWSGTGLSLLNIQESWRSYKPASLPLTQWKPAMVTREAIEKKYDDEFMTVLKIGIQTKTRRYKQAIDRDPGDLDAHLQIGIILANAGDREESMKYFDKVLKQDQANAAALNNRGNLHFLNGKHKEAESDYLAATRSDASDPYTWVNLARTYKELKQPGKAKEAFRKAVDIEPSVKREYRVLSLELLNSL